MNSQAISRIKDRDIIVFLGNTGNGKSTTIHYLSGSKMKLVKVGNVTHIAPTEITNKDAKEITSSPMTSSVTKILHPVEIELNSGRNKHILLVDTPGFNNTEGPCVDIINGINIIDAIRSASSVKPIIILRMLNLGGRCEGIKEISRVIAQLIENVADEIERFQWIFTDFNENVKDGLGFLIEDILYSDKDEDELFLMVLQDLHNKLEDNRYVYFVDPLDESH